MDHAAVRARGRAFLNRVYQRADAFLFGRRTYETFAGSWEPGQIRATTPFGRALQTPSSTRHRPRSPTPRWADTTVLSGDVAAAVCELKATGGELQVHGGGELIRWLLDNQLVDEITLLVCPVALGQGTRLCPDSGPDIAVDLAESRSTPNGVTIQVDRPTGRPHYASATLPAPSK